jgi:hypothetical protein
MKAKILFATILALQINLCVAQTTLKYYGIDDMDPSQFSFLRDSLKGNFALVELQSDTSTWRYALSQAEKNNIKLIIWPLGNGQRYTPWTFTVVPWGWDISKGLDVLKFAEQYIASGGKALLAVLMSHEPFYSQGEAIFTSAQLKLLYSSMKAVAPHVQTYIYMNDMAYYDRIDPNRRMEDGIMDICGTYKHSFGTKNTQAETLQEIDDDYDLIQRKGLHMQLFFALQTFGYSTSDYRMPLASEMQDLTTKILEKRKLDGAFWYPWNRVSTSYTNYLSKDRYDSLGGDRWSVVSRLSSYLTLTDIKERSIEPAQFSLSQNFPNPFNPSTTLQFSVPKSGFYSLKVFNMLGQQVADLIDREISAGSYTVKFNAESLPSGVYFYSLRGNDVTLSKKMAVVR